MSVFCSVWRHTIRSILGPIDPQHKAQIPHSAHDVDQVNAVVYADAQVDDAFVGVPFIDLDVLDRAALLHKPPFF